MKFSLICTTRTRNRELKRFLLSLEEQSYRNFELILVDQNPPYVLENILKELQLSFPIRIISINNPIGLSRARNHGLQWADGEVIAFPDDDCEYPENLLECVALEFSEQPLIHIVSGCCRSRELLEFSSGRYSHLRSTLTKENFWTRHISVGIFVKKAVFLQIGNFDERFGVGSRYGSGEETDFLLRALQAGFQGVYDPEIYAFHPDPPRDSSENGLRRARMYGLGWGALFKKHIVLYGQYYLVWRYLYSLLRSSGAIFLFFLFCKFSSAKFYLYSTWGRIDGFLSFELNDKNRLEK